MDQAYGSGWRKPTSEEPFPHLTENVCDQHDFLAADLGLMAWPRPRSPLPHWKALSLGGSGCGQPTFREGEVCTTPLRPRPKYKSCGSLCGSFVPTCLNQHGSMGGCCILWVIIQHCIILVLLFQLQLSGAPVSFDTLLQADHLVYFLPSSSKKPLF